jgi:thiol-disulfide isomerase/thioredoxin
MLGNSRTWPGRVLARGLGAAWVVSSLLALGCAAHAQVQVPKSDKVEPKKVGTDARRDDPQARALFDSVAKAYQALKSYSDQGTFVVAMKIGGRAQKHELPLKLTLVRPNKLDLDAGPVRITCDGKTLTTAALSLKRYTTAPAPETIGFETFREGPLGAVLFGGPSGPPMAVLLNLLVGADPAAAVGQLGGSLQTASAEPKPAPGKAETARAAILIDLPEGQPDIELTVDPVTKLLSAIEMKMSPQLIAQAAPAGQSLEVERFGWSSGPISTEVAKDRSFAYAAPKDFAKVDELLQREEVGANDSMVGAPAPDFTLTVLDGPAKTKTITKAELAGKVVVIDLWATWCGPCMKELPEIQKVIEQYAQSKKNVVVAAVSQDDEPSELSAVRKRVEKTLADANINLQNGNVGLVGLDPSKSVGGAFRVQGYPTLVILDGKGIVQSVHLGFDSNAKEPFSKELAREIDALLEGKSLVAPKQKAAHAAKE